jgi:hypothetical protein
MKTYKELREYMRGLAIGPVDTLKPMADLGGSQSSPDRRYTAQLPQLAATAKGPGLGTIKPMVTASKKKEKK